MASTWMPRGRPRATALGAAGETRHPLNRLVMMHATRRHHTLTRLNALDGHAVGSHSQESRVCVLAYSQVRGSDRQRLLPMHPVCSHGAAIRGCGGIADGGSGNCLSSGVNWTLSSVVAWYWTTLIICSGTLGGLMLLGAVSKAFCSRVKDSEVEAQGYISARQWFGTLGTVGFFMWAIIWTIISFYWLFVGSWSDGWRATLGGLLVSDMGLLVLANSIVKSKAVDKAIHHVAILS
jgi:hypothetical protein